MQVVPDPGGKATFYPVETAGPAIRGIFLMDTLKGDDSLQIVLKNYLGLFRALRNQPVYYVILVTFDLVSAKKSGISASDFLAMVDDFSDQLRKGLPTAHRMDLRTLSTEEMCRLLAQAIDDPDCLDCKSLQYPSLFAQDPFVALRYPPGFLTMLSSVVSPVAFSYSFVAGAIASGLLETLRLSHPSRLNFAGGNILCQRDWAIVGMDTILENRKNDFLETDGVDMPPDGYSDARLIRAFKVQLGVEAIYVSGTAFTYPISPSFQQGRQQPAFHVDYYLTPAGLQANRETGELQELIFVGQLATYNPPTDDKSKELMALMERGLEEAASFFAGQKTPAGRSFKVVRIPLLLVGTTPQRTIVNKLLSFNQVLVQQEGQRGTVFLPDYTGEENGVSAPEFAPWQDEAIRIYEEEGFEVVMVQGRYRNYSFQNGGSLHCIAKVIEREAELGEK